MIIKNAIAPQLDKHVQEMYQNQHFLILCDEGTSAGRRKDSVILVPISVTTEFLDRPICNVGTL